MAAHPADISQAFPPGMAEVAGRRIVNDFESRMAALEAERVADDLLSATTVEISYAASGTTDGIEATFQVVDGEGDPIAAIHTLNVWISDDADGSGLTATSASGALTAATGTILTALTAVKHVVANTADDGELVLRLVDSANTADERFCVANPVNGQAIVGDATVAGDYEGGA